MRVKFKQDFSARKFNRKAVKKIFKPKAFSKRQNLSSSKFALITLGLILVIIIVGRLVGIVGSLTKPFSQDLLSKKQYSWDGKSSINLVFKLSSLWFLNFDPVENKAVVLKIPSDLYMELPKGFGTWRVGAIYGLGQEEKPPIGSALVKDSLSKLLGLPVDGFITINNLNTTDELPSLILSWNKGPLEAFKFFSKVRTDLTPIETFKLILGLSQVRADKVASFNIEQSDITESKLLPDSSRVLGINYVNLDLFIRSKMADEKISQEDLSIAIFNSTNHLGLAQEASRIITNLGGDPIIITNTEAAIDKSVVLFDELTDTAKRLAEIFAPACLKQKCSSKDPKIKESRARINVVLGEDFYFGRYAR